MGVTVVLTAIAAGPLPSVAARVPAPARVTSLAEAADRFVHLARFGMAVAAPGVATLREAQSAVPDNPCYLVTCGPNQPVVVENPAAGPGAFIAHLNGETDLQAINAPEAWSYTHGNAGVLVAVLSTGVSTANVQLQGKVVQGPDVCASHDSLCASPTDNYGDGTFSAGLIAASDDDGVGMASLGWDVRVLSVKILDDRGEDPAPYGSADMATGIMDAVKLGARVIDLPTSDEPCDVAPTQCGPDPATMAAVQYAEQHGAVVVATAGDYDTTDPVFPAGYPGVLAVAGATDAGQVDPPDGGPYYDFSEYGEHAANIAAPGVDLLSTWYDGNYAEASGSEFATALVAASAALVLSVEPSLSAPQVVALLRSTASPLATGSAVINGGFLNVGAAVQEAAQGLAPDHVDGYDIVASNGAVINAGSALPEGSPMGLKLNGPIVGAAARPDGLGYWLVTAKGSVYAYGDAHFYGPTAALKPKKPVVGIFSTADGDGYWLVTSGGSVYAYGDAHFYGPRSKLKLGSPIVGMAPTPDGDGYWLAAKGGGVFAFGDARNLGSAASRHLKSAIAGMASTADGAGYWLVARNGSIYDFGDAGFYGSEDGANLSQPIVGLAVSPGGTGYWMVTSGGQVFSFGTAGYEPSDNDASPGAAVVGISS